jgi:hypothetical protein
MPFPFWLRPTTEYFDCAQFDKVVERVGATLAEKNRYSMKSRVGSKAFSDAKNRTIRFDKKWFLNLSPQARCAVLVHEVWHITTLKDKILARNRFLLYVFPGLLASSFGFVVVIYAATLFLMGRGVFLPGLPIILYPLMLVFGMPYGFRRWSWPFEYASDEAGVRYIGVDATKEVIRSLKLNTDVTTHPSTRLRLANVDRVAAKYPIPEIDFNSLERAVKQEFVFKA